MKTAEVEVESLEASGPADLTCLSALSRELNRKICVWSSGMSLKHESGAERSGESLNVQFHSQPEDVMGHWSLLGDSDPQEAESGLNDCLFNAIAAQTGIRPSELREATVARMKTNIRSVARRIQEIARQEACDRIVLMVGGARYVGRGPEDAARILDNSQRGQSHPNRYPGHPRGHASNPGATGPLDSAENYSQNPDAANCDDAPEDDYWKAGFLSIKEQDYFAHLVLSSPEAQEAMKKLNEGTGSELVRVKPAALPCEAPMGANFTNGFMGRPNPISELVIILKHHLNKKSDPNHDVFVFTFYPRLKKL
ncbi:GSCOCG00006735001-RA-CDS [Cotesia congregata]|nr:GSCOCG00006735001-RA-CDS [Cotesia congregata]